MGKLSNQRETTFLQLKTEYRTAMSFKNKLKTTYYHQNKVKKNHIQYQKSEIIL